MTVTGEMTHEKYNQFKVTPQYQGHAYLELLRHKLNLAPNILAGVEAIGAGYDIYGHYAFAKSITTQLFDWSKAQTSPVVFDKSTVVPTPITVEQLNNTQYKSFSGTNIGRYQNSLSVPADIGGAFNLFSSAVTNDFSSRSLREAENEFTRIQQTINLWSLKLVMDPQPLRALLKQEIQDDIDAANTASDYAQLFSQYGSHFLTGIVIGGRAVLASSTNKINMDKTYPIDTIAKAVYQKLTGQISLEDQQEYEEAMHSFNAHSNSRHLIIGGDPSPAIHAFSGHNKPFMAWSDSLHQAPSMVDFTDEQPLTGIWELCSQLENKQKMHTYFKEVWVLGAFKSHQIWADYIDSIIIIRGDHSSIKPPSGYVKISINLNKDSGGDYIYLCYHKVSADGARTDNSDCISDIQIIMGEHTQPSVGFTKLDVDLNRGSGGEYIYLCYKKSAFIDAIAIKDLDVISGSNPDLPAPFGFSRLEHDLNKGSGGDYIYLCYSSSV
ncbi:MAC/perforin domain-containing protein [Shewanella surugensis]|uniref:MACPF domain-containing protein n=1 Tax=Shewanella surugensis TaxID=212020 RepID=A0ABT0LET2_9GAMM|nr:MAC/perforin domain-containing protein [Shewanella surugensis]MCL1125845.1 MACPF domain-containing protein [Shewanella surugensis]